MTSNWAAVPMRGFDPLGQGKAHGGIPSAFMVAGVVKLFLCVRHRIKPTCARRVIMAKQGISTTSAKV